MLNIVIIRENSIPPLRYFFQRPLQHLAQEDTRREKDKNKNGQQRNTSPDDNAFHFLHGNQVLLPLIFDTGKL